ncbi:MAG TPA: putative maltokinase [Mesorhizobium sp.]|jgi:maltose alpha-D-glucosyltransferase/alpha-amylase|nr:putative maltokinase [Mesorhizobium sp.]
MTEDGRGQDATTTTELAVLTSPDGLLTTALNGPGRTRIEERTLPALLPTQRWFGGKDKPIEGVALAPLGELEPGAHALLAADVAFADEIQRYLLPVSALWDGEGARESGTAPVLARLALGARSGVLIDGALDQSLASALLDAMREGRRIEGEVGEIVCEATNALRSLGALGPPKPLGAEQSNVSIAFGKEIILKLYRRLRAGEQPDVEVARFLTKVGRFANTPEFLGEIRHVAEWGQPTTLAAAFAFVPNQGDAWSVVTEALHRDLQAAASGEGFSPAASMGELLGRRTAEMHKALATQTDDPSFSVERLSPGDVAAWAGEAAAEAEALLDALQSRLPELRPTSRELAAEVLSKREALLGRLRAATEMAPSGGRSRNHGDYHLGQVLVSDGDFVIIDFEGEPRRSLAERRQKSSPLRDVAGMLRSFDYAAWTGLSRCENPTEAVKRRAEAWRRETGADFLRGYRRHVVGAASYPDDERFAGALTGLFLLQKAVYEVGYELANRPDWIDIPLTGVRDLLAEA